MRGRGAKGKIPVFGMLKRGDKVYTQIVKNCSISELLPIIQGKIEPNTVLYTDGFKTYDGLVNYGYKEHFRVKHGENEFASGHNHINGIENFWGLCKVRLAKFRGCLLYTSDRRSLDTRQRPFFVALQFPAIFYRRSKSTTRCGSSRNRTRKFSLPRT